MEIKGLATEELVAAQKEARRLEAEWKQQSILGRLGQAIEPAVRPLGWDWRMGVAALASFPAREVVVGTLGILYQTGKVDADEIRDADDLEEHALVGQLRSTATMTPASALSLMVFFALCCQCASTLAVIKRETKTWRWPIFTFTYMTVLAYVGALLVYQVGSCISGSTLMSRWPRKMGKEQPMLRGNSWQWSPALFWRQSPFSREEDPRSTLGKHKKKGCAGGLRCLAHRP